MDSAEFLQYLLEATVASSSAVVVLLSLRRSVRAVFGAQVAYAIWWMVPAAMIAVLLPAMQTASPQTVVVFVQSVAPATAIRVADLEAMDSVPWLVAVWLAGAGAMALRFVHRQRAFERSLGRIVIRADGMQQAQSVAGLPAALGLWNPRVIVPSDFDQRYAAEEQCLLREHERAHIRHGDLQWNAFAALVRCMFWFNPLLHWVARYFRHDQELACDQRVMARHPHARRSYGEAMLKTQLAAQVPPVGCHWGFSHPLTERIAMLKTPVPTKNRRLAGIACLFALTVACGYAAWATQPVKKTAEIPADSIGVELSMQIDDGAAEEKTFVIRPGAPISMTHTMGGHVWSVTAKAGRGQGQEAGMLMFDASLMKDGKEIGTPRIGTRSGLPGVIRIGEDKSAVGGKFEGVKLEVVITDPTVAPTAPPSGSEGIKVSDSLQRLDAPKYPPEALARKVDGTVVLLIDLDARGRVTAVQVDRSEPADVFDAAAVEAAWKWQFNPPMENGRPVSGRVSVPIEFRSNSSKPGTGGPTSGV